MARIHDQLAALRHSAPTALTLDQVHAHVSALLPAIDGPITKVRLDPPSHGTIAVHVTRFGRVTVGLAQIGVAENAGQRWLSFEVVDAVIVQDTIFGFVPFGPKSSAALSPLRDLGEHVRAMGGGVHGAVAAPPAAASVTPAETTAVPVSSQWTAGHDAPAQALPGGAVPGGAAPLLTAGRADRRSQGMVLAVIGWMLVIAGMVWGATGFYVSQAVWLLLLLGVGAGCAAWGTKLLRTARPTVAAGPPGLPTATQSGAAGAGQGSARPAVQQHVRTARLRAASSLQELSSRLGAVGTDGSPDQAPLSQAPLSQAPPSQVPPSQAPVSQAPPERESHPAEPATASGSIPDLVARVTDPDLDAASLLDIATHHPSLRPLVAVHPHTYPALLDWLAQLDDPTVQAALAHRRARDAG